MSEEIKNTTEPVVEGVSSSIDGANVGEESILEKIGYFFQGKAKYILIGIGVVVLGILGYKGYQKFIVEPNNVESAEGIYQGESLMIDEQNWEAIISGKEDGSYAGMVVDAKKHDGYAGGEIAAYDLGIAYLNNGQPQEALKQFESVDFDDENLATMALGAMGDASMDMDKLDDAISYYSEAYERRPKNTMTAPLYMLKLAIAHEKANKLDDATKLYTDLIENFPNSQLRAQAEKNKAFTSKGKSIFTFK